MAEWEMVIGLEVHCQLGTKTKLFCRCSTDGFGAVANTRVCPVCTGQPGVLPVLNGKAVELGFQAALALDCELAPVSIFARKNYFYPDLPKAYQISQYELPFSKNGRLSIRLKDYEKTVRIHRIHLEEDAGKLLHAIGSEQLDCSLVDFNRGGTPLIEIVSEPDIKTSDEAYAYLTDLREVLVYTGVSRCDMEKGEMRCDANVSVMPKGSTKFGTRAEIKNLNSFKNVKDAIEYEFRRQVELVESGGRVVQETRLWDAVNGRTNSMRSKEEAHDYRYFPDPDLVPLEADATWVAQLKARLPELPEARRRRFASEYQLPAGDAEVLTGDRALAERFDEAAKGKSPATAKLIANWFTSEFLARVNAERVEIAQAPVTGARIAELVELIEKGVISTAGAKKAFAAMWETGKAPKDLVAELGLAQVSDESQLKDWVKQAMDSNPKVVEDIKAGKERAIGSIVGAVMKLSKGKANPGLINKLVKELVAG